MGSDFLKKGGGLSSPNGKGRSPARILDETVFFDFLAKDSTRPTNEEDSPLSLKRKLCLKHLAVKVHKRNCGVLRHNLSEDQLSKWKHQFVENAASLFESSDKVSEDTAERIAHLEQLVGRLTVALDIQKKALTWLT